MTALERIAIVGASLGGIRTVRALRLKGFEGAITLIGEEDRPPYDRPPLSKEFLVSAAPIEPMPLEPAAFYDGIDLRLGVQATVLRRRNRALELSDGSIVKADHIVIATGSLARPLPLLEGIPGVHVLRTVDDATQIRHRLDSAPRVAIVGGGFLGCEVAASIRSKGLPVTMIEAQRAPLVRGVGVLVGETIAALHREHGVDVRLGVTVDSVEQDESGVRALRLSDGTRIGAELVVVGVGTNPRTDWLDGSGVVLGDGVMCDDRCRVQGGGGHIWAVGEVSRWPSRRFGEMLRVDHWTTTAEQSSALAANLLDGDSASVFDPVPYIWSDQYEHRFQIVGQVSASDDLTLLHGSLRERRFTVGYSRNGRLRGVVGCDEPTVVAAARTHLGEEIRGLVLSR